MWSANRSSSLSVCGIASRRIALFQPQASPLEKPSWPWIACWMKLAVAPPSSGSPPLPGWSSIRSIVAPRLDITNCTLGHHAESRSFTPDASSEPLQAARLDESGNRQTRQLASAPERRALWQDESYNHLVRKGDGFRRVQRYIQGNPVQASLAPKPEKMSGPARGRLRGRRRPGACPTNTGSRQKCRNSDATTEVVL